MPPVEAVASTAPAKRDDSPMLFISGMVKVPVVATLATALPLNEPVSADEITATGRAAAAASGGGQRQIVEQRGCAADAEKGAEQNKHYDGRGGGGQGDAENPSPVMNSRYSRRSTEKPRGRRCP